MPTTIELPSPAEVRAQLTARLPAALLSTATIETKGKADQPPWLWVKFPERIDKEYWAVLKDIGFSYSKKREAHYHTCESDPRKLWRSRRPRPGKPSTSPKPSTTPTKPKEDERKKKRCAAPAFNFKPL